LLHENQHNGFMYNVSYQSQSTAIHKHFYKPVLPLILQKCVWVDLKPKSQQQLSSQVSPARRIVFRAQFPPDAAALGPLLPSNLCCCCCSVCTLLLPGHKRLSPVRFPFLDRASNKQKRRATRANGNKRRCFGRA
jgi:hypothetical protein